jgi:hypothetical protein
MYATDNDCPNDRTGGWGSWMEWTPRLGGTAIGGQSRSFDVMAISRPDGVGEIANLGRMLDEATLLPAQVQQQVVAAQAHHHAMFRQTVSHTPGGATRRVGGRIGLRPRSARSA